MLITPADDSLGGLVLDLPADFHEVPLLPDTPERTAAQLELLDDMGLVDPAQREALSLYLEALSVRLGRGAVTGSAFCAVRLDGRPSTATVTVAVHATHTLDRGLAVLGAAEALRRQGHHESVEIVELGQQPAVTAVTERRSRPGDAATGEVGVPVREMSVFVPVAGQQRAAMVTVSTPCLQDWDVYVRLTLDLCRSVHTVAGHTSLSR